MNIVVDLIVLGIIGLCITFGYIRGLTGSLLKIISFVLALVISLILFKPVSSLIINNTNWDEGLETAIRQTIITEEVVTQTQETEEIEETEEQSMPDVIINYINETIVNAGEDAKEAIVDVAARNVAVTIINIATFICLFIIARIALILVRGLTNLITKLPVIKQADKLGGVLFGLLQSLAIIYIALAIISFASPVMTDSGIIDAIQKSYIASILYNNNLLLTIIF